MVQGGGSYFGLPVRNSVRSSRTSSVNKTLGSSKSEDMTSSTSKLTRSSYGSPMSRLDSLDDGSRLAERASTRTTPHDRATSQMFDAVVVPIKSADEDVKPALRRTPRTGRSANSDAVGPRDSSISSTLSSYGVKSDEDETPETSAVATPAVVMTGNNSSSSSNKPAQNSARISAAVRMKELQASRYSMASSGRKNVYDSDEDSEPEESLDALIARRLQSEEDARAAASLSQGVGFNKKRRIDVDFAVNSEDDSLSSSPSTPVTDTEFTDGLRSTKRLKQSEMFESQTSKPPGRAARETALQSLASKSNLKIEDSEESNVELTELDTDDFALEDDSDELDTDMEEDGQGPAPVNYVDNGFDEGLRQPHAYRRERRARGAVQRAVHTRADKERQKLERHHPEIRTMWETLATVPVIPREMAPQPQSITRTLKSFQLEGLNWMIKQEQTEWKGGLLGDEMGMGKTIQAVSLIMSDYPAPSPSLVVVPPVALMQWQNEIKEYTSGRLKVLVYHGAHVKKLSIKELKKYDVLMTSYSTLEVVHRKERKGWARKDEDGDKVLVKEDSPLHAIQFHRVILDEAHNIKSRTSGTAKACFALKADYKWCLSGTPLQNRIGELFSLLRFLNVQPFACYMCKSCSCKEVHWALDGKTRMCKVCFHRGFDHISVFNTELLDPIVNHGNSGLGKEAFTKLRVLMDRIMLRRVKADQSASMELPPKDIIIHSEFFGEIERDFAGSIMSNTTRQFDTYVAQGVMLNNYANIFGLIMQMRQVADHPDMILKKHAAGGQNVLVCVICDDVAEDVVRSTCRHDFCRTCVRNYLKGFAEQGDGGFDEDPDCPRCHIPLAIDLEQEECVQDEEAVKKNSIINRIRMENWTSSTKIEMLVYELAQMRSSKRTVKSIVFSQFTSMLQLVEWRLRRAGFNTVMLDGTMTPTQRQSSIDYFMKNADVEVFLVSLKAGGVALNLTEASRVFLIDPWWNPAAEWQSADRCHRIGQRRPCLITRLVIEDSVESRMVLLQEKKANMINGTINADETAMQNLTPEDMQFLFRGG